MKKYFLSLALLFSILNGLSAQKVISGIVKNDKGEPLVGANIILKARQLEL